MANNPQTLQAFLEDEAQRWEEATLAERQSLQRRNRYHTNAARLRQLAQAMADRVVVRALMGGGRAGFHALWDDGDATVLQARLTSEGRGWPEEG